jgi:hypothetical protein
MRLAGPDVGGHHPGRTMANRGSIQIVRPLPAIAKKRILIDTWDAMGMKVTRMQCFRAPTRHENYDPEMGRMYRLQ